MYSYHQMPNFFAFLYVFNPTIWHAGLSHISQSIIPYWINDVADRQLKHWLITQAKAKIIELKLKLHDNSDGDSLCIRQRKLSKKKGGWFVESLVGLEIKNKGTYNKPFYSCTFNFLWSLTREKNIIIWDKFPL